MKAIILFLLAPSVALAATYDPSDARTALEGHAAAAYTAADTAAGTPLEAEKAASIKANLDQAAAEAGLAENGAKSLETEGSLRAGEMKNALKGKDERAKSLADGSQTARNRWKKLTADQADLKAKVDALPDEKPAGKPNEDKSRLKDTLDQAATYLQSADANLTLSENGASAMSSSVDQMTSLQHRSISPAEERKSADDDAVAAADSLPPPTAEAKAAVDLLGHEPQAENRTRAGSKLGVPRDITRRLLSDADRAGHRDEDFASLSDAFDRALAAFTDADKASDGKTDAAKGFLDQGEAAQNDVRSRLAHN
ncbi:MAG: hypothetical protein KGJ84_12095 [Elusimicrobia bacterium]|nr:hypothetical protein [Elusimicrobiota bacterium]